MATEEAIAGMLSIGHTSDGQAATFGRALVTKTKRKRVEPMPPEEIAENISNVHQDDEYSK